MGDTAILERPPQAATEGAEAVRKKEGAVGEGEEVSERTYEAEAKQLHTSVDLSVDTAIAGGQQTVATITADLSLEDRVAVAEELDRVATVQDTMAALGVKAKHELTVATGVKPPRGLLEMGVDVSELNSVKAFIAHEGKVSAEASEKIRTFLDGKKTEDAAKSIDFLGNKDAYWRKLLLPIREMKETLIEQGVVTKEEYNAMIRAPVSGHPQVERDFLSVLKKVEQGVAKIPEELRDAHERFVGTLTTLKNILPEMQDAYDRV